MDNLLIRSDTEEEYSEFTQLLEDISTYRRDMQGFKEKEKENKMQKEKSDKEKAEEMRAAALSGIASKYIFSLLLLTFSMHCVYEGLKYTSLNFPVTAGVYI